MKRTQAAADTKGTGASRRPELLAPAGTMEALCAAISAGADAVYLGAKDYSARAYADNFDEAALGEAIDYAHLFNRRVYLTCNILLREDELSDALQMVEGLYARGLDGVIVQDLGLLAGLARRFPGLALHASTQMAVLSAAGALWLRNRGVRRVIPGRELSLTELRQIRESGVEVECFVHGAMCYAYSGRCLFSSIAGGRSGNRGRCAGPCRKRYVAQDGAEGYLLSMKDQCALERIGELIDAGIDSFKIEGRMKPAEYVAGVTAVYRKYIDQYLSQRALSVNAEDAGTLDALYIRSQKQDGYLHRHNGREMVSLSSPAYTKTPDALLCDLRERHIAHSPRISVSMHCYLYAGAEAYLTAECAGTTVGVQGALLQEAKGRGTTKEEVARQLGKTGGTPFVLTKCSVETDGRTFLPVSVMNALRRDALEALRQELLSPMRRDAADTVVPAAGQLREDGDAGAAPALRERQLREDGDAGAAPALRVGVRTLSQAEVALARPEVEGVILGLNLYAKAWESLQAMAGGKAIYLRMPEILRQKDLSRVEDMLCAVLDHGVAGVYCGSIDALALAGKYVPGARLHTEESVYAWNAACVLDTLRGLGGVTYSYEQNHGELLALHDRIGGTCMELVLYGYLPLMYSANCVRKTTRGCESDAGPSCITDEEGRRFMVWPVHAYCYNILYNCVPLSMHGIFPTLLCEAIAGVYRLEFTLETPSQEGGLLDMFCAILTRKPVKTEEAIRFPEGGYTKGHERRGVL